jgi:hypothetical protein
MSITTDLAPEPLVLGDLAAMDEETPVRWGWVLLKTSAGPRCGPVSAEVFMAKDRSRFRVIDCATGRAEYLSSLQFCKFILELRAMGRFDFERKPKRRVVPPANTAPSPATASRHRHHHRRRVGEH